MAERDSLSPSPSRPRSSRAAVALASRPAHASLGDGLDDLDDEEDEEVLQLQLQQIQTKLRLKKLQAAKAQRSGARADVGSGTRPESAGPLSSRPRLPLSATEPHLRPKSQNAVEVPASPVRRLEASEAIQKSPSRVLLGIDKGLKAKDVSLKKAPSVRRAQQAREGGPLADHSRGVAPAERTRRDVSEERPRPFSFNERLATARTEEAQRRERQARIQQARSTAFSVGREEVEEFKARAVDIPNTAAQAPAFSRDEILGVGKPKAGGLQRSNTVPSVRPGGHNLEDPSGEAAEAADETSFESYSGFHLSKRILPHPVVTRAVAGKQCYGIQDLLKLVTAPNFSLPDLEVDIVVLAIVASKSDPRDHKPKADTDGARQQQPSNRGKYMVLTLTDLTYDVELFLFKTGFDRYWKLTPGTVVAVLNPEVMPPPRGREATGRFGLVIGSDGDTILEVGAARDLGFCKAAKRDGQLCSAWVHARRSEYCEFHTNEAIGRTRRGRNELNATGFGGRRHNSYVVPDPPPGRPAAARYDRDAHSRFFVSGGSASSAAALLDADGRPAAPPSSVAERRLASKRRLAARERETDMHRRLGALGSGAGRDYMRHAAAAAAGPAPSSSAVSSSSPSDVAAVETARTLGLLTRTAASVRLSPGGGKRKRPASSASGGSSVAGATAGAALGWGSSLSHKLARMREGENLRKAGAATAGAGVGEAAAAGGGAGSRSPVRKKTRFVTDKGIREAGRESLGAELAGGGGGGGGGLGRRRVVSGAAGDGEEEEEDELVIL